MADYRVPFALNYRSIMDLANNHYGLIDQVKNDTELDYFEEQIRTKGFVVIPQVCNNTALEALSAKIEVAEKETFALLAKYGLQASAEANTLRAPLIEHEEFFFQIAANPKLLIVCERLLGGKRGFFEFNQQNVIINRPQSAHQQSNWHRDYPYLGLITDNPIGLSAVVCITNLTEANGATWVLPFSHKMNKTPSDEYFIDHAVQIEAAAGSAIVFDSLLWHRAGQNTTNETRTIVNNMYSNPILKQQINLPRALAAAGRRYPAEFDKLLGYTSSSPDSVEQFIAKRA